MKLLIFSGIVSGYKGLVAGGMNLTIETNEMSPEDTAQIVGLHRKPVKVMIQEGQIIEDETGFNEKDFEDFNNTQFDEFDKRQDKTPSQRLRNVMWVLYNQDPGDHSDFKAYYEFRMEKLIALLKSKIED